MQIAVLILFATREIRIVGGRDRRRLRVRRHGLRTGVDVGAAIVSEFRYRSGDRPRSDSDRVWVAAFGLTGGPPWHN
jgi:hypothetical protein